MTVTARPTTRRALGAVAALALGTGLAAAAGEVPAQALDRSERTARVAPRLEQGQVVSRVVALGERLVVRSSVGPLDEPSFVESTIDGFLTTACFAGGAPVADTTAAAGRVRTGTLDGYPFSGGGYAVEADLGAIPTTGTVDAGVVLKNVLRDRAGELQQLRCPAGSAPGFHTYRVDAVQSYRYTFAGELTGSSSLPQALTYSFPAPAA